MKKKECKHKWRVGSHNGVMVNGKIIKVSLNIWCEGCNKKIKAMLKSDIKFKRRSKNGKEINRKRN